MTASQATKYYCPDCKNVWSCNSQLEDEPVDGDPSLLPNAACHCCYDVDDSQ